MTYNNFISEARLLITDACIYSCSWCAINRYKQGLPIVGSGYNEGALVQNKKDTINKILTTEDYGFLSQVLYNSFHTKDFTLTGGEAFLRKDYTEITKIIKRNQDTKITTLTKGAPLHDLLQKFPNALDYTDRVIFSIDTLDHKEHAELHLPLTNQSRALKYLDKTKNAIEKTMQLGVQSSINTVLLPDINKSTEIFHKILDFANSYSISNIKFLELDTNDIHTGYIEKLVKQIIQDSQHPLIKNAKIIPITPNTKKQLILEIEGIHKNLIKVYIYRGTCSQEHKFPAQGGPKGCELSQYGSMTINTTGDIIPCTGDPKKKIPLLDEIRHRKAIDLEQKIQEGIQEIINQSCPIFINPLQHGNITNK